MNNSVSETHSARSLPGKLFSFVSGGGGDGSGGAGVVCDLIIISLLITIECASLFIACARLLARSRLNRNKQRLQLVKTRVILSNICSVLALGIYLQIN
jgi:hypothetical protein